MRFPTLVAGLKGSGVAETSDGTGYSIAAIPPSLRVALEVSNSGRSAESAPVLGIVFGPLFYPTKCILFWKRGIRETFYWTIFNFGVVLAVESCAQPADHGAVRYLYSFA